MSSILEVLQKYAFINLSTWLQYSEVVLCMVCEKPLGGDRSERYCDNKDCKRYGLITIYAIKEVK